MSVTITKPAHVYSPSTVGIMEHLRTVSFTVDQLMELNGGMEPADIITSWRDDGPEAGEHNGWMSIIKWPIKVVVK